MIDERVVPGLTDTKNLAKHILRYNLALLAADKKRVFDLSCGTGYGSFLLSLVADEVVGVDISRDAIDYALNSFTRPNISYSHSDILNYSNAETADVIVSFETIEHIRNTQKLLDKFDSLLKPGGSIVYSIPISEPWDNPHHVNKFTFDEASRLFTDRGYKKEFEVFQVDLVCLPKQPRPTDHGYYIGQVTK